jgi:LPXTG-motif cell wall-anchored protein
VCTITETDTDGGIVTISPASPITVEAAASTEVTITNTYPPKGSLTLQKAIVDPAPDDGAGDAPSFPFSVTCTPETGAPVTLTGSLDRDGTPVTLFPLPVPSTCVITETDTDGGIASFGPSDAVEVTGTDAVLVTITNTYTSMTITKSVSGTPTDNGNGTFTTIYDVVASNTGTAATTYTLTDALQYSPSLTVTSASVASVTPDVTASSTWNGTTDTAIVTDQAIAAGGVHAFKVVVTARPGSTFNGATSDCTLQSGETGTGSLNRATLTFAGETTAVTACGDLPPIVLPPVPPTTAPPATLVPPTTTSTLPKTGGNATGPVLAGVVALLTGAFLVLVAMRRRRHI